MQHQYVSKNRRSGLWLMPGAPARIFCSWWWAPREKTLYVKRGPVTRTWSAGNVGELVLRHLERDLPEIAKGIAHQIEEYRAAA